LFLLYLKLSTLRTIAV